MTQTIQNQTDEPKGWWQSLKDKFNQAYQGLVGLVKNPFSGMTDYAQHADNPDRIAIKSLRDKHYEMIRDESKKSNPDYNQLTKIITADTKQYIQTLIKEEETKLGKPPCNYSVITLGSMARQESGPVTDLEIGFLIKDKTVASYRYFHELAQRLSDRLFLLGEHPDIGGKGLRMDEANNAPPHLRFFARNATPEQAQELLNEAMMERQWDKIPFEGSRPFLATPEEFASYSDPNFQQDKNKLKQLKEQQYAIELKNALADPKNKEKQNSRTGRKQIENEARFWINQMYRPFSVKELQTANDAGKKLGRNIDLLSGDNKLYDKFMSKRDKYLQTPQDNGIKYRQKIAKDCMIEDVNKRIQDEKSIFSTGKLGKTLDIKRELYRFGEQFITNLGFYHRCKSQNTLDILDDLKQRQIISPELYGKLTDYMQFATGLRLKEQACIKRQGFAAYFDAAAFQEDKADLETEIDLLSKSIEYLKSVKSDSNTIAAKQRELVKLQDKLHHLEDMAPGKIYSAEDVKLLREKYAPMAKQLCNYAIAWTKGKEKLGFAPEMPVVKGLTPALKRQIEHAPKLRPVQLEEEVMPKVKCRMG